jgi:hypothetical protein
MSKSFDMKDIDQSRHILDMQIIRHKKDETIVVTGEVH